MFSITCGSCAAKLKVRNVRAVGQVLACPRCGEMVRVVAPEGFVPPPSESAGLSAESDPSFSGASALSDFDDIPDSLLRPGAGKPKSIEQPNGNGTARSESFVAGPPSGAIETGPTTKQPAANLPVGRAAANAAFVAAESDRRRRELSAAPAAPENATTPTLNWSSAETARRRKIMLAAVAGVAAVALIAGIAIWFRGRGPDPVATATSGDPTSLPRAAPGATVVPVPDPNEKSGAETAPQIPANSPDQNPSPAGAAESSADGMGDPVNSGEAGAAPSVQPTPPQAVEAPPPIEDLDDPPVPVEQEQPLANNQQPGNQESPLGARPGQTGDDRLPGHVPVAGINDSIPDALGELTSILEQQGRTLTAIENEARASLPQRTTGLPALLLRKAAPPEPVDLAAVMKLEAARISYTEVPHVVVMRELGQLMGVPVAWDLRAMEASGIDVSHPVTFDLRNGTLADAVAAAASANKLEAVVQPWGLAIVVPGDREIDTKSFPADGTPLIASQLELLAGALPKLVDPPSWTLTDPPRSVVIEGDKLAVQQSRRNLRELGQLVERLGAAAGGQDIVMTRLQRARPSLEAALQLEKDFGSTLDEFLSRVGAETGVVITVDWSLVTATGWTPQAEVPGQIEATTIRQLLDQLAQTMDLEWLAVGPRSFMLTTREAARQIIDVEVYRVGPLLNLQLTSERLGEVLYRTVAAGSPPGTTMWAEFDPVTQSLMVAGPQLVQRQVTRVLEQLAPRASPEPLPAEQPVQSGGELPVGG